MTKMYLQGSSERGQVTLEVDAPLSELAEIPQKLKSVGLPQLEGELRVQLEGKINIGLRTQKFTINCGSNDLSLITQKLGPHVTED